MANFLRFAITLCNEHPAEHSNWHAQNYPNRDNHFNCGHDFLLLKLVSVAGTDLRLWVAAVQYRIMSADPLYIELHTIL